MSFWHIIPPPPQRKILKNFKCVFVNCLWQDLFLYEIQRGCYWRLFIKIYQMQQLSKDKCLVPTGWRQATAQKTLARECWGVQRRCRKEFGDVSRCYGKCINGVMELASMLGCLKMVAWVIFHSLQEKYRFSSTIALDPEHSSNNVDHLWKI